MSNSEQDLALVEALLKRGALDEAEQLMDKVERIAKAQQAADDAEDDQDDLDDDAGDDGDDEEEDDGDDVAKAIRYPHSDDDFLSTQHDNMGPVSAQTLSPYPHATGITDVVQQPARHGFDVLVSRIMERDGSSRNAAMVTARLENPRLYADYQRAHAASTTQQQAMSRGWSRGPITKLGLPKTPPLYPESDLQAELASSSREKKKTHARRVRRHNQQVKTHEDAVADQMAKGLSREIAEQRVLYAFGNTLPRSDILKGAGDTLVTTFMAKVDACMINEDVDRTEAMRRVRKRSPSLYDMFQIV
jgi:hypothetical protein